MKKSDLKNGAIVELRDGYKYILLFDRTYFDVQDTLLICLDDGCYSKLSYYDEDLRDCDDSNLDIMKVAQSEYVGDDIRNHVLKKNENDWTWIRDESETVMTISEIEEKLGISNLKIKKDD